MEKGLVRFGVYTANLAAFMLRTETIYPIDNKDDIMALFDLAEAYLFTSLDAKQSAKTNFIVESKTYLVRTKKRLKKSKNATLKQRYDIMNLVHETIEWREASHGEQLQVTSVSVAEIDLAAAAIRDQGLFLVSAGNHEVLE